MARQPSANRWVGRVPSLPVEREVPLQIDKRRTSLWVLKGPTHLMNTQRSQEPQYHLLLAFVDLNAACASAYVAQGAQSPVDPAVPAQEERPSVVPAGS